MGRDLATPFEGPPLRPSVILGRVLPVSRDWATSTFSTERQRDDARGDVSQHGEGSDQELMQVDCETAPSSKKQVGGHFSLEQLP